MSRQPRTRSSGRGPVPQQAFSGIGTNSSIRIDIDPAVSAGYIHDRYDLLLRGRAVSDVPVEEVVIRLDDAVIGRVRYGRPDQPANGGGGQRVFHVNVSLRRAEAHRMCTCSITAHAANGDTHEARFDLAVDPSSSIPVSIASGPTHASSGYAHVRPPVVLYVERAALDDNGLLLVHGWAVSLTPMVAVQVFLDEARISDAQLGGQRDDVGSAFPAYPNAGLAGFTLSQRIDAAADTVVTVRVQAIGRNGFAHEAVVPVERLRALAPGPARDATAPLATPLLSPTLQQPTYRLVAGFTLGPDLPSRFRHRSPRWRRPLGVIRVGTSASTAMRWTSMPMVSCG